MNQHITRLYQHTLSFIFLVSACLFMLPALAATGVPQSEADIRAEYQRNIERCERGETTHLDVATCKREAGAALQEAQRNRLITHAPTYEQNATLRCNALPVDRREACLAQMTGQDPNARTTTQGSVAGGGILRVTEITTPAHTITEGSVTIPATANPSAISR